MPEGEKVVRFHVRTNSFADTFYKVRTTISSTIDASFSRTLRYEKSQHEGNTRREIVVEYDYEKGEAKYLQEGNSPKITKIPGPVFDPLSIAYFFRLHPLEPGAKTKLPTCDGKRLQEVIVTAGQREHISLARVRLLQSVLLLLWKIWVVFSIRAPRECFKSGIQTMKEEFPFG